MTISKTQTWLKGRNLWLLVAALALLGGGFLAARLLATTPSANTANVEAEASPPTPQQVMVTALGRLEPEGELVKVGGPSSERVARMTVKEGDYVTKGTVLAYLESYEERLAERDYAASQLAEAESKLQAETQYGRAQVQEAQTRLQQVDRPGEFEIQAQQAAVRELEAQLNLAQIDLRRFEDLRREGAIAQQELDQQITEVRGVQEQLNNARSTLIRLQNAWTADRSNARAQVQSARAELVRSQTQIEVDSAARNLQLAEAKLERTIIRAPSDGEIFRIVTQQGEAIGQEGTILEMGDNRQMYVVAEVYESDIGRVRQGQRATITSRNGAFDEALTGQVERVGSQIFKNNVLDDDPAADADARIVEVKIRLNQSEAVAQLTNLQVDVQIDVQ